MKFSFASFLVFILSFSSFAQSPADTLHFHSKAIRNGNYTVEITLPHNYDANKAYPICYFLDLMLAEPLMKDISDSLQRNGLVSDYIFVGIKCDDTAKWSITQRVQDFTPAYSEEMDLYVGNKDSALHISGGAKRFLSFLKKEIIPTVEQKYKSIPAQRTLFGMSLSGLFAAYVLVEEPALFTQYIVGAPSLWYNNAIMIQRLQEMNPKKLASVKHVYMGIGDQENSFMIKLFNNYASILEEKSVKVTVEIYPGKDHVGIWSICLSNGIKSTFPKK